jgi:hypothetical protein
MAKKDKAKGKAAKKAAGVKVPKTLRKLGPLDKLINSQLGREILADALIAAAGAAAAALVKNRPSAGQVTDAGVAVVDAGAKAASGGKDLVGTATGAVAEVVADAARQFLPAALTGDTKPGRAKGEDRDERIGEVAYAEGSRKKKRDKPKHSEH